MSASSPFSLSKGKLFRNYFSTLSKLMCLVGLHYCRENKSFMFEVGSAPVIVSILFLLLFSGKSRTAQLFGNCNYRRRLGCFTLCLRHNVSPRQLQSRIYVAAINPVAMEQIVLCTSVATAGERVQLLKIFKGPCQHHLIFLLFWLKPNEETGSSNLPPRVCELSQE